MKKDQLIRNIKKELGEIMSNKFVNDMEWYEVYIRGSPFNLDKCQKNINVSC